MRRLSVYEELCYLYGTMTKAFWSISGLAVYLYVITILTQYGFSSYFGIPSNFIEASITANTIYFYTLLQAIVALAFAIKWWWLLIIPVVIILSIVFQKHHIKSGVTLLLLVSVYGFVSFGHLWAANQTAFLTLPNGCADGNASQKYIIPEVYNGQAILVPIDADNKLVGGFLVKDVASLNCYLKHTEIGLIR